ncbi:MAG: NADPH-dependent FMN reductase [Caldilineaceae bacterium]|nr:NADPH-dependent FMN reductase [Caldilineaceae bacterium]
MSDILTIAGSPSAPSRSAAVLAYTRGFLEKHGLATDAIHVRDLDAGDLLSARFDGASIRDSIAKVQRARAVVIATPVYKAAYSGVLKAFLDLLPQDALADKSVFPIATAGSSSHLLAIDYALKPVLFALGAQHVLKGLYIQDSQLQQGDNDLVTLDSALLQRLQVTLLTLVTTLGQSHFYHNGHSDPTHIKIAQVLSQPVLQ